MSQSSWTQLKALQIKFVSYPVKINDTEFIVAPDKKWSFNQPLAKLEGLHKYNITTNKWKLSIPYPSNFKNQNHAISCDTEYQLLYLIGGGQDNLTTINLKTHSTKITPFQVIEHIHNHYFFLS